MTATKWTRLFNHCWNIPNTITDEALKKEWAPYFANVVVAEDLELFALHEIPAGHELCFDYGIAYWTESLTKPFWDLRGAPQSLVDALYTDGDLRLLGLASAALLDDDGPAPQWLPAVPAWETLHARSQWDDLTPIGKPDFFADPIN